MKSGTEKNVISRQPDVRPKGGETDPTLRYYEDHAEEFAANTVHADMEDIRSRFLAHVPEGGRIPLRLDPGLIFGTGSHATTRMCLQALEDYAGPGKRVLDLGCGSGILGIGALVLGCDSCLGCDIDPKAPDVAAANAALNGFGPERIRIVAGDVIADASLRRTFGTGYDIVLANIVSDVIIPLSVHVPAFLRRDGVFITSGIIEGRQAEVEAAIEKAGFRIVRHLYEEDWHCFVAEPA